MLEPELVFLLIVSVMQRLLLLPFRKSVDPWVLPAAAIVGDIAPSDNVSKEEKRRLEEGAMQRIHCMLGQGSAAGVALHLPRASAQQKPSSSPSAHLGSDSAAHTKHFLLLQNQYTAASLAECGQRFYSTMRHHLHPIFCVNAQVRSAMCVQLDLAHQAGSLASVWGPQDLNSFSYAHQAWSWRSYFLSMRRGRRRRRVWSRTLTRLVPGGSAAKLLL